MKFKTNVPVKKQREIVKMGNTVQAAYIGFLNASDETLEAKQAEFEKLWQEFVGLAVEAPDTNLTNLDVLTTAQLEEVLRGFFRSAFIVQT